VSAQSADSIVQAAAMSVYGREQFG